MSAPTGKIGEYSREECLEIIRQMAEAGIQEVSLTGGEALVQSAFREIVTALTDAGIRIDTIMSNGLLVTGDLLRFLKELGQKPEFNMSFDGIGRHDWLRGVEGVEDAVLRAFRLCREHGFPTGAEYCLHKGNLDVFSESVELLASLGCGSLKVNGISDEGEAVNIRECILSLEEEYQTYLDCLPRFFEAGMPLNLMLSGLFANRGEKCFVPFVRMPEERDCGNFCLCGHARNQMHITADGFIVPCIPIGSVECGRTHFPNLKDMRLTEALSDSAYMSFIDTRLAEYFRVHPECEACSYRNRCGGGCRGRAAASGDLMAKDPKACRFFLDGWYDRVLQLLAQYGKMPEEAYSPENTDESGQPSIAK